MNAPARLTQLPTIHYLRKEPLTPACDSRSCRWYVEGLYSSRCCPDHGPVLELLGEGGVVAWSGALREFLEGNRDELQDHELEAVWLLRQGEEAHVGCGGGWSTVRRVAELGGGW